MDLSQILSPSKNPRFIIDSGLEKNLTQVPSKTRFSCTKSLATHKRGCFSLNITLVYRASLTQCEKAHLPTPSDISMTQQNPFFIQINFRQP